MYDYKLHLIIRTPQACLWEQSVWGKKTKKIVRNSLERIEANAINTYKDDVRMYKNDLRLKELFDQYLYIVTKEIEFKKEDIRKYLLQIGFKEKK